MPLKNEFEEKLWHHLLNNFITSNFSEKGDLDLICEMSRDQQEQTSYSSLIKFRILI